MTSQLPNPLPFKISTVLAACERLAPLEHRRLLKGMYKGQEPAEASPGAALRIWFKDLLKVFPIEQEQRELIYEELGDKVERFGDELFDSYNDRELFTESHKIPVSYVGLADRKFLAMTGIRDLMDLTTGKRVDGTKFQFLETIQYNLTTLFISKYLKCKHNYGGQDGAPSVSETAEVK